MLWRWHPTRVMTSSFLRFLDHTQRPTTVGRTPLDEWSARRRDLYLTTHNTHNRQTSMTPVGFEPTISTGERPQNYALDRAATGTGNKFLHWTYNQKIIIIIIQKNIYFPNPVPTQCRYVIQIHFFYTHGSVHRRLLSRNTNKMQLCNRIYYSKVF